MKITYDYCQQLGWRKKPTYTHTPILFEHPGGSETHQQLCLQVEMGSHCSRQLSVPCSSLGWTHAPPLSSHAVGCACHCGCERSCLSRCSWFLPHRRHTVIILSHLPSWTWFIQLSVWHWQHSRHPSSLPGRGEAAPLCAVRACVFLQVLLFSGNRKNQDPDCIGSLKAECGGVLRARTGERRRVFH